MRLRICSRRSRRSRGPSELRGQIALGIAVACLSLSFFGAAAAAAEARTRTLADFAGTFVYDGGDEEGAHLDAAIEGVVASLNFLLRPIARSRLSSTNQPYDHIRIQVRAEGLTIARGSDLVWTVAADDTPTKVKRPGGVIFVVHRRFEMGEVIEEIDAGSGRRRNRYALSADGQVLSLTVTIAAERLPTPLVYTHHYRRMDVSAPG
ncbi:MAG: hypothetical protein JRG89_24100 [Deltaproteobacteria bacterium]|nr:hypothetical protein [Deltaproteobacteria bacterium]MBW2391487.1 hypothetical protein [Deltaproteobacteria bacterium]MBW2726337.1 hypothetical protein [Deltaproteobacteria bacterium]